MPTKNYQINSTTREQDETSFDVTKTIKRGVKEGSGP